MKRRGLELGLAAVAVILILASVLSDHWWSGTFVGLELRIGLRAITACGMGECHSLSFDEIAKGGKGISPFHLSATVTLMAGVGVALLIAASAAMRGLRDERMLSKATAIACCILLAMGLATWMWFPGDRLGGALTLSWGLPALVAGIVAAISGEIAGSSSFASADPATYRVVALGLPKAAAAPAPASAPSSALASSPATASSPVSSEAQLRKDLRESVAELRDVAGPADLRAAVRSRHVGMGAKVRPASVNAAADALRFVARSLTIDDGGVSAELADGGTIRLAWSEISRIFAGQLPPDPPFEKSVFVDLVSAGRPLRLMQKTKANFQALPGGAAATSLDNLRRLAALIQSRNAAVELDPATQAFVRDRKSPRQFAGVEQFAAYDARYGG